jgi:hypothetical protein
MEDYALKCESSNNKLRHLRHDRELMSFTFYQQILRSHVMVRVGGGWDTLSHYLDKHDPCRCRAQHRSSVAAKIFTKTNQQNGIELHKAQVVYER